jgi:hypothetical protein
MIIIVLQWLTWQFGSNPAKDTYANVPSQFIAFVSLLSTETKILKGKLEGKGSLVYVKNYVGSGRKQYEPSLICT